MMVQLKREALPLGDSVVFTGEVFDTRAITLGFDIATCTSNENNEGIPNSLIEAMAAGKPIVSTRVGDIAELVIEGKSGLLFKEKDSQELVRALSVLVEDGDLREQYGKAGINRIKKDFDLVNQIKQYATLYQELLKSK